MTLLNVTSTETLPPTEDTTTFEIMTDLNKQELVVTIKSPIIRDFFKGRAVGEQNTPALGPIFIVPELPRINGVRFDLPGSSLIQADEGILNLTCLRAVRLAEGVEIRERGVPLTQNYVKLLEESIGCALKIFYAELLRPIKTSCAIRFEQVA